MDIVKIIDDNVTPPLARVQTLMDSWCRMSQQTHWARGGFFGFFCLVYPMRTF